MFIYSANYLTHSYGIYAASAMAGNAVSRSLIGGTLPLAGPSLYKALGPNWAGTLLGLLEVIIIPIPFLFYRYGAKIREKSILIRDMRQIERHQKRKREKAEQRLRMAEASGNPAEERFARSELTRVKSYQVYGLPDTPAEERDIEKEAHAESTHVQAQAELTHVQGLDQEDVEKDAGVSMARL